MSRRGYKLVAPIEITTAAATPSGPGRPVPVPALAVLPFANLSGAPDDEYLCDGLAEELINGLTKLSPLRVVAHSSWFAFRGRNLDAREIGRQLDVTAILEGSLRRSGDHLRVSAQLIDAGSGITCGASNRIEDPKTCSRSRTRSPTRSCGRCASSCSTAARARW